MPPRRKGSASAKKAKGPSPRTRRASRTAAAGENAAPEPEVPTVIAEENAPPEPEVPAFAVEEDAPPEPEVRTDPHEQNATSEPDVPTAPAEENDAPEPEVPTDAPEENAAPEAEVRMDSPEENAVPEPEFQSEAPKPEAPVVPVEEVKAPEPVEEKLVPEPEAQTSSVKWEEGSKAEVFVSDVKEDEGMEDLIVEEVKVLESEELTKLKDGDLEAVESVVGGEMNEEDELPTDGVSEGDDMQMDQEQGIEQESVVEETVLEDKNIGAGGDDAGADKDDGNDDVGADEDDGDDDAGGAVEGDDKVEDAGKSESDVDEDDEENDEDLEEDHSIFMHAPLSEKKKQKDFEIFIGGLDREAVEDDLVKVFGAYGEIQSVRIVKHPTTHKSKGFAFIRYGTIEQAKKVLADLKDGTEVRGKRVGLSASQDNDTLYLGNICKTWTKDNVIEALKGYGIEQIDEVFLPEDPKNEGKIKGYAFVEFSTHSDAMAAFQRLRKPDAVFGCDRSAKVAFAPSSMHPSEEILSQVKTVFVEGLPESWDEQKVLEHCQQYGEVEKVQLSRYFTNARRRDFGFVAFISRESAIACVEGINSAQLGDGEIKVKANIAKPQNKGRLAKQGARGGFKVNKDGENTEAGGSNMKGNAKFKQVVVKGKVQKGKLQSGRGGNPSRPQGQFTGGQGNASFQYHQRREQPFKGGKRDGRFMDNARPSKKARDNRNFSNMHGRHSGSWNNPHFGKSKKNFYKRPPSYRNPYPPAYGPPTTSYQGYQGGAYGSASGSKRPYPDMVPHAGYVQPAVKQARGAYGYAQGSAGGYDVQGTSAAGGYAGGAVPPSSQVPNYSGYAGYEAGYGYPNNATYHPPQNNASYPPQNNAAAYPPPSNAGYPPQGNPAYPPHGAYY
eukprot:TRINITY_DN1649_c0_g1_i5.p1 TRINITY_DN1649_c0_g1~~TRINITY_DN1649_c0_g1_i5.p1  ORF type:complete len:893 (-),score=253.86 TRINITY_DN1649_c0_g1_i5:288-2966(-)